MNECSEIAFVVENFDDDVDAVTNIIGFPPSAIVSAGWSSLPASPVWIFKLPQAQGVDICGKIEAIVAHLNLYSKGVAMVKEKFKAYISINLDDSDWIYPYDPLGYRAVEFQIGDEIFSKLANLGLPLFFRVFRAEKPQSMGNQ